MPGTPRRASARLDSGFHTRPRCPRQHSCTAALDERAANNPHHATSRRRSTRRIRAVIPIILRCADTAPPRAVPYTLNLSLRDARGDLVVMAAPRTRRLIATPQLDCANTQPRSESACHQRGRRAAARRARCNQLPSPRRGAVSGCGTSSRPRRLTAGSCGREHAMYIDHPTSRAARWSTRGVSPHRRIIDERIAAAATANIPHRPGEALSSRTNRAPPDDARREHAPSLGEGMSFTRGVSFTPIAAEISW